MMASSEAYVTAGIAAMRGDEDHVVAGKMLKVYRKRVRANRRRLSRK
jgi:hypothetical protein